MPFLGIAAAGWALRIPMLTKKEVFPSMLLLRVYSQLVLKVTRPPWWEDLASAARDACRFAWR